MDHGLLGELLYAARPLIINDLVVPEADPGYEHLAGMRSLACAPGYDHDNAAALYHLQA